VLAQRPSHVATGELTGDTSFAALVEVWLEDLDVASKLAPSTRALYERNMRPPVMPAFEHYVLREITVRKVDQVIKTLTVEDLSEMPWVLTFNQRTAFTTAVQQLRMQSFEPRAEIVTENFLTVGPLIAGSDRVALGLRAGPGPRWLRSIVVEAASRSPDGGPTGRPHFCEFVQCTNPNQAPSGEAAGRRGCCRGPGGSEPRGAGRAGKGA
jgi:hypothetical protein